MERKGNLDPLNRSFTCAWSVGTKAPQTVTHFNLTLPRRLPGLLLSSIRFYTALRLSAQ